MSTCNNPLIYHSYNCLFLKPYKKKQEKILKSCTKITSFFSMIVSRQKKKNYTIETYYYNVYIQN